MNTPEEMDATKAKINALDNSLETLKADNKQLREQLTTAEFESRRYQSECEMWKKRFLASSAALQSDNERLKGELEAERKKPCVSYISSSEHPGCVWLRDGTKVELCQKDGRARLRVANQAAVVLKGDSTLWPTKDAPHGYCETCRYPLSTHCEECDGLDELEATRNTLVAEVEELTALKARVREVGEPFAAVVRNAEANNSDLDPGKPLIDYDVSGGHLMLDHCVAVRDLLASLDQPAAPEQPTPAHGKESAA